MGKRSIKLVAFSGKSIYADSLIWWVIPLSLVSHITPIWGMLDAIEELLDDFKGV
jgi:hypothetical protein